MCAKMACAAAVVLLLAGLVSADVPLLLNYQGKLMEAGKPAEGLKSVTFRFYDDGGNLLGGFVETQNVEVTKGIFNVLIGSITTGGVPASIFENVNVYLEVMVGGEAQAPRQRIASVGFAIKALSSESAGQATWADFCNHAEMADVAGDADTLDGVHASALEESAEITSAVAAHASSNAHDGRYYTETESDTRFVNAGETNSITSAMIVDGTIAGADITGSYKPAQAANADYATQAGNADTVDGLHASDLEESAEITAAVAAHASSAAHDGRYYTETESDARFELKGQAGFSLPYDGSTASALPALSITNTSGTIAIRGLATNTGAVTNYGGYFEAYGVTGRGVGAAVNGDQARGVQGLALGGHGIGAYGECSGSAGFGVYGKGATGVVGESTTGWGVRGTTTSTNAWAPAVYGECQGAGDGTYGLSFNRNGAVGVTQSADANAAGVWALNSGAGPGIFAEAGSGGWAAVLKGNLQIKSKATGLPVVELGEGLDYAEGFDVSDAASITPGCVVVIDPARPGKLALSTKAYDRAVAGIVAGAGGLGSGVKLGTGTFDRDVALAGRVYCNVDATDCEVKPGDLLTTSPTPGHAMAVRDFPRAQGAVLGKAMEALPRGTKGRILVLVALQ